MISNDGNCLPTIVFVQPQPYNCTSLLKSPKEKWSLQLSSTVQMSGGEEAEQQGEMTWEHASSDEGDLDRTDLNEPPWNSWGFSLPSLALPASSCNKHPLLTTGTQTHPLLTTDTHRHTHWLRTGTHTHTHCRQLVHNYIYNLYIILYATWGDSFFILPHGSVVSVCTHTPTADNWYTIIYIYNLYIYKERI